MQSSVELVPIIHPKHFRRFTRSWKHRTKRYSQYRIVRMY